ncbi:hydantoinase/oxoprolinase family protein [Pseudonocardia xishanensis]|uniref:Hydantoinase/oxoprolinase family protein n=1 Tax=Pseudonocardia xishanensis TaxID=630995 RepID=A0ABP8RV66_9PSEU
MNSADEAPYLRVAVDVGGTFTDVFVQNERTGKSHVAKVPSTADPIDGVLAGVRAAGIDLDRVALFAHGTTVATNALITRNFPLAAMVTTAGFRDVIEIRRGTKQDLWDTYLDVAPPPIPRRHRLTVPERVDFSGKVLGALDEVEARRVAKVLRARKMTTVAVCFANSHANPVNELRMCEILREELPDAYITASSDVLPEIFEHERFSTTVANAVLAPKVSAYVNNLQDKLAGDGYHHDLLVLHSGGGVMTPATIERHGARLAASGIAAGAIATRHLAELCGFGNAIGLDMGGTSTDITLVADGEIRMTNQWFVEYGYPICFPSIEVLTIGAGGGSLAWIDEGGSLRNGPQSAGSVPGPAAYGNGGTVPTNTDANIVLGRLGSSLIDGGMSLDREAAATAIKAVVGDSLGMNVEDAAEAIVAVANANMADAVRLLSIRRGYDPRDFALVAFGGAGPLHGVDVARELSIPTVLVPPSPGVTSAFGCLLVDIQHDLSTMYLARADTARLEDVEEAFERLETEANKRLDAESVAPGDRAIERFVDMRYVGQWRSMSVPVGHPVRSIDDITAAFHNEHEREHSYRRDDAPVEIYRLAVRAVGAVQKPELTPAERVDTTWTPNPLGHRSVRYTGGREAVETPVFDRTHLPAGAELRGPAIIQQLDSTVVVPPDAAAVVDRWGTIVITV